MRFLRTTGQKRTLMLSSKIQVLNGQEDGLFEFEVVGVVRRKAKVGVPA